MTLPPHLTLQNFASLTGTLDFPSYKESFYRLVTEYLPDSDKERLEQYAPLFPKAFLMLLLHDEVIGVAFGWDRKLQVPEDDSFVLNGIAVHENYQQKGYGTLLLQAFEEAAKEYGTAEVSLGSAGGYVEKFYIQNGYFPTEYKVWEEDGPVVEKEFKCLDEYYSYKRLTKNGFVVMRKNVK